VRGHGALLLAGDAAGLADPLTGEGISYAVLSGKMAAEALVRAGKDPERASSEYEALLASDLLGEIRTARLISDILYLMPQFAFRLFHRQQRFPEAVVDVFAGLRSYRGLLRRAWSRPWLFLR
jgi:flavin-dependent dehydrogenase